MSVRERSAAAKVRKSVPWAMLEGAVNIGYGLSTVAIIGFFIAPGELGRAGIATATVLLVEAFTGLGLQEGVIRARSGDTATTDATFALACISASAGYVIAVAVAAIIAGLMHIEGVFPLTMLAALTIPFNALAAVPTAIMARKLRSKQLSLRIVSAKVVALMTLVICAVSGLGAASIVSSFVAAAGASCGLVWLITNRRPRFRPDRSVTKDMVTFGVFISLENLSWNATIRLFAILFGHFHGLTSLGLFQFAARLTDELAALVQIVVARVGLSFFSHVERSGSDSKPAFQLGTHILLSAATPLFVGLACIAPVLIPSLFAERWTGAVPFLQILALSWPFTFARVLVSPVLRAKGKPFIYTIGLTGSAIMTLTACYLLRTSDPRTAALSYVVSQLFAVPFFALVTARYLGTSIRCQVELAGLPALGGLVIFVVTFAVSALTSDWSNPIARISAIVISAATAYTPLMLLSSRLRSFLPQRTTQRATG